MGGKGCSQQRKGHHDVTSFHAECSESTCDLGRLLHNEAIDQFLRTSESPAFPRVLEQAPADARRLPPVSHPLCNCPEVSFLGSDGKFHRPRPVETVGSCPQSRLSFPSLSPPVFPLCNCELCQPCSVTCSLLLQGPQGWEWGEDGAAPDSGGLGETGSGQSSRALLEVCSEAYFNDTLRLCVRLFQRHKTS